MRKLLKFMLPVMVFACGDIIVSPDGNSSGAVAFEEDASAGGESVPLQATVPVQCPISEPVQPSILLYVDAGAGGDDGGFDTLVCGMTAGGACEYGTSLDRACNRTYACETEEWTLQPNAQTCYDKFCPATTAKTTDLSGTPCDLRGDAGAEDPNAEAICPVADGDCICTTGGPNSAAHGRMWVCQTPQFGCPLHRPGLGSECQVGTTCDYGSCSSKRGSAVVCNNGQWLETSTSCN